MVQYARHKSVIASALLSVFLIGDAQAACQQQMTSFNQMSVPANEKAITQALSELEASTDCGTAEKHLARRATANRLFRLAYQGSTAGLLTAEVDRLLERAETIAPTWRTLSFSATRDHQNGRYNAAARRFQSALALIDDSAETPKPPSLETIGQLHQLATESVLLADEFVPPPQVRGITGGVLAESVRGFSVQRSPLPIRFETGSTDFTRQGEVAATALLNALKVQGTSPVEIVGHADERGDAQYNYELSLQRAEKVRDWLNANGLNRDIRASGRGEQEPMSLNDASLYTEEQRWQLNRRVELVRDLGNS